MNISKIKALIEELRYYLQELPNKIYDNGNVYEDFYDEINSVINELEKLTEEDFSRYIISPIYDEQLDDSFPVTEAQCRSNIERLTLRITTQFIDPHQKDNLETPSALYVKESIIKGFKTKTGVFNYKKLIGLINELNKNYVLANPYSCLALIRAITDHIPPLLGFANFEELVNNYRGSRTDKDYMFRLLRDRPISDDTLHRPISKSEDLIDMDNVPNKQLLNRLLQECLDNTVETEIPAKKLPKKEKKTSPSIDPSLRPLITAAITTLRGGPDGYFAEFDLNNEGEGLAILTEVMLGDVKIPVRASTLSKGNLHHITSISLEGSKLREGSLAEPTLAIAYENINKEKFKTVYAIELEHRADKKYNIKSFNYPIFTTE